MRSSLLHSILSLNWRLILALTTCLITLHFLLINYDVHIWDAVLPNPSAEQQATAPTAPPTTPLAPHTSHEPGFFDYFFDGLKDKLAHVTESHDNSYAAASIGESSPNSESTATTKSEGAQKNTSIHSRPKVEESGTINSEESLPTSATATQEKEPKKNSSTTSINANDQEEYVAICLSLKDQALDLPEWLKHHYYHLGIKRFYIMDDGSDPPMSTVDIDYGIPQEAITFHYQPRETRAHHMQSIFYYQCNDWWGSNHTWIAYIDIDEFLEITAPDETLVSILQGMDDDDLIGALGVHWKMHNSNGLLKRPASNRKAFTTCLWDDPDELHGGTDDNHHIKSIVKTKFFTTCQNPHKFGLRDGAMTVSEHGDIIRSIAWRSPVTRDRIGLHHYAVKSREEFEEKMQRGNGMSDPKAEGFWEHMETQVPTVECNEMVKYDP